MRLPGTWEVWQASFQHDRRFWLFDPCNLESWRKIVAGWDPAHFQPGGVIFGWYKEAQRRAQAKAADDERLAPAPWETTRARSQPLQRGQPGEELIDS